MYETFSVSTKSCIHTSTILGTEDRGKERIRKSRKRKKERW